MFFQKNTDFSVCGKIERISHRCSVSCVLIVDWKNKKTTCWMVNLKPVGGFFIVLRSIY